LQVKKPFAGGFLRRFPSKHDTEQTIVHPAPPPPWLFDLAGVLVGF
jgi:hypothetical protein